MEYEIGFWACMIISAIFAASGKDNRGVAWAVLGFAYLILGVVKNV